MIIYTLLAFGGLFLTAGMYLVLADIFRIPTRKASRAIAGIIRQREPRPSGINIWLEALACKIAGTVRLSRGKREALQSDLSALGNRLTPEMYTANCIVKSLITAVFAVPAAFIFPLAAPCILVFAVVNYFSLMGEPARKISSRREAIENELPMFTARIESMLRHTRDVVAIISSYRKNAGPELSLELGITLADIKSGGTRAALSRLEARVGSPLLSDVTRGLGAVLDGNDPVGYWTDLSARLHDHRRQTLMREADKIPPKISRLSLLLLGCIMLLFLTVIIVEASASLGMIFG